MKNRFLICMMLGLSFMLTEREDALASDTLTVLNDNGNNIEIEINDDLKGEFNIEDFQDVINEMTEDSKITIHDFVDFSTYEQNDIQEVKNRMALVPIYKYKTTKSYTATNTVLKDVFVISVARGQTTTLSKTFTASLDLSISGSFYDKANLGLNTNVTAKITTTHKFTGPSAPYNSREYRVKFYGNKGTYKQQKLDGYTNAVVGTKSGSFVEPTKYLMYSVDSKVS